MDPDLRLAALARLASSDTEESRQLLTKELSAAAETLRTSTDFDAIEVAVQIARTIGRLMPADTVKALGEFAHSILSRSLDLGGPEEDKYFSKYKTRESLSLKAIEAASDLRYLVTKEVIEVLLSLSQVKAQSVADKAVGELKELAEFDLAVFYGDESRPGLGPSPQLAFLDRLRALDDKGILKFQNVIFAVLPLLLSPTIQGASWSYKSLTLSRGPIPAAEGIARLRSDAIDLAKRMYRLDSTPRFRLRVLQCLNQAMRRERASDESLKKMYVRDAKDVLQFFVSVLDDAEMPIRQRIEHDAYWVYFHGDSETRAVALEVRNHLSRLPEYEIYRNLIGFEGVFGDWENLRRNDDSWEKVDAKRRAAADQYVEEITEESYAMWRERIVRFARTESDDLAMFPVFYEFLQKFAERKPRLAFRLLSEETEALDRFLIPLIRGLWRGEAGEGMLALANRWVSQGIHLTALAKSLYGMPGLRRELLDAIVERAASSNNVVAIDVAMDVAASLYVAGDKTTSRVFMRAVREMTRLKSTRWVEGPWHGRDMRQLVSELDADERAEVLTNLVFLPRIDYHAEDILAAIAKRDPESVVTYLVARVQAEPIGDEGEQHFEAVPYQLDQLHEILEESAGLIVSALRRRYENDDEALFRFRGARLLRVIFPAFGAALETELLRLVGRGEDADLDFVASVLQTYDGSESILRVCKAIIMSVPIGSRLWSEVAAAIESTGVVHGEFGLAEAYERKRDQLAPWLVDDDLRIREFAKRLSLDLTRMAEAERLRAKEDVALRKFRYGAGES